MLQPSLLLKHATSTHKNTLRRNVERIPSSCSSVGVTTDGSERACTFEKDHLPAAVCAGKVTLSQLPKAAYRNNCWLPLAVSCYIAVILEYIITDLAMARGQGRDSGTNVYEYMRVRRRVFILLRIRMLLCIVS